MTHLTQQQMSQLLDGARQKDPSGKQALTSPFPCCATLPTARMVWVWVDGAPTLTIAPLMGCDECCLETVDVRKRANGQKLCELCAGETMKKSQELYPCPHLVIDRGGHCEQCFKFMGPEKQTELVGNAAPRPRTRLKVRKRKPPRAANPRTWPGHRSRFFAFK